MQISHGVTYVKPLRSVGRCYPGGINMHVGSFVCDQAVELQGDGSPAVGLRNGVVFATLIWVMIATSVAGIIT